MENKTVLQNVLLAKQSRKEIVNALSEKVDVPKDSKLSELIPYIELIDSGKGGARIIIQATDYEGETLKARLNDDEIKAEVKDGQAVFTVKIEGVWTVSAEDGKSIEVEVKFEYETEIKKATIYGFEINSLESDPYKRVTYTDDAVGMTPAKMNYTTGKFDYGSWEDVWFIKDNHVYALNSVGGRVNQCKDDNYSQFIDGTSSNYNSSSNSYNFMASIPLCWIHRSMDGNNRVVKISDTKVDETYHAYGWEDRNGYVQDCFYMSAFLGSTINSRTRSLGGQTTESNIRYDNARVNATANGTGWDTWDFCKWTALQDLCVLISKSTDSQTAFGEGLTAGTLGNTGTVYNKGRFWGEQTATKVVKVFHIENPWGSIKNPIGGFGVLNSGEVYVKTHNPYNSTAEGFTLINNVKWTSNVDGYIGRGTETEYGFIPTLAYGTDSTYECDYIYFSRPQSGNVAMLYVCGGKSVKKQGGLFNWRWTTGNSVDSNTGTALSFTPQGNKGHPPA